ncbi:MAG TPA: glutamate synthase large subunit [Balneola sp.]|nr:glutamate synthase large subunit [Balneola sp.]MAO78527.1 glutamate synthase large subunit [Balneola sp.]MBF64892.1 glutamate synthase large subunit [Balneola sp.]HBZ38305.1 glutamate synthase large subunit [Balneola sp.]
MSNKFNYCSDEHSACGVGFITSRKKKYTHSHLIEGLHALRCVEHRGACSADGITGDGAGIMTDIPFEMLGFEKDTVAVATLFLATDEDKQRSALNIFEKTFNFFGLEILDYRDVPVNHSILGKDAAANVPVIKHAIIKRPERSKTNFSFDKRLYNAKQLTRSKLSEALLIQSLHFASLSAQTIVYKALTKAEALDEFYPDLKNKKFTTRFCLFHRRFSTNTKTSWDKIQPFRLIGHNGEINTIAGNRSWAKSREKMIGAERNEILTRKNISDSGSLNEMVEALRYRSSIPNLEDILAIMMPPATEENEFYTFWSRAMEPWDGPAFITYANGYTIGARLDRNGFRPCRWVRTEDHFYLSSEAGTFHIEENKIEGKGTLFAGRGVTVDLSSGEVLFRDPSHSKENHDATFDARLKPIPELVGDIGTSYKKKLAVFSYTDEELAKVIYHMAKTGKEPVGSMGDTARLAVLSTEPRSFFDFFYQNFSQVTNPPLDYIREKIVTDLTVHLGKKPNIFEPKELIPAAPAYELKSPFLSLAQMEFLRSLITKRSPSDRVVPFEIDTTFKRSHGIVGFKSRLNAIGKEAIEAVKNGYTIIILSDRNSDYDSPGIPSLLGLRRVVNALNDEGLKLNASVVIDSGEVKSTHHASALIGFGAQAVCPFLALDIARNDEHRSLKDLDADIKERNLLKAFDTGLLKIMAKSGISVVRSYQSAKMYSALGLGPKVIEEYFPQVQSPVGGIEIDQIAERVLNGTQRLSKEEFENYKPIKSFQYKEHARDKMGEKHSMTNSRSKIIHDLVRDKNLDLSDMSLFDEYLKLGLNDEPVALRHLFKPKYAEKGMSLNKVKPVAHILQKFGSGAMSFGAISAESQRDIFLAMKEIGGRCNSGEGGENPYYYTDGISASVKQIASGRFGVTAEYLVSGEEIQIKVCQGAKPGEGGQLMGLKVNEDIAKARYANPGFDLISPPPLHDIYSIEDLKQLIHDLKQLYPAGKVSVKLVSGVNIGTIAVGVAKAGADIIQVSGGEGGTGAASLSSMKHAGLPWEIGLLEVHQSLIENDLRDHIVLRTDGGLSSGKDIILASILGAEEFDFGKLLLIAEGCVMARICEKNTCPTGIATHDPKFKAKYKGNKDHIVDTLTYLAEDVRRELAKIGKESLQEIMGNTKLLSINDVHEPLINKLGLDLSFFTSASVYNKTENKKSLSDAITPLNSKIINDLKDKIGQNKPINAEYDIYNTDRSVLATLFGLLAEKESKSRLASIKKRNNEIKRYDQEIDLVFRGSAGQSFGVFQTERVNVRLIGEANDSVCKSMSGGKMVIVPPENARYKPEENAIIGNCALYGATNGKFYVYGQAGDRFAVRNSGALAVVEGTGLHACEYMTNGTVVILGNTSDNIGAGMTGGELYLYEDPLLKANGDYIVKTAMTQSDTKKLKRIVEDYFNETQSSKAKYILSDWENISNRFCKYVPHSMVEKDLMVENK